MKPRVEIISISREEFESMVISPRSGMVLVHIPYWNKDETTEGGIIIVGDDDYKPYDHTEKWGVVAKVPPDLFYEPYNAAGMDWKTDIEIQEGDEVWFDYRQAANTDNIECDGRFYKLLEYRYLYVARRGDTVIPLNGYVLFREFEDSHDSDIIVSTNIDPKYGIVAYVGSYNQDYLMSEYSDDIEISPGDHVLFEANTSCFALESDLHKHFSDEKFILQQRKKVLAVIDETHSKVLRLHAKAFSLDVVDRDLKKGVLEVVRDPKRYDVGAVVESMLPYLCPGDVVVVPKGKGTLFGGLRYYPEDRIMYYESKNKS